MGAEARDGGGVLERIGGAVGVDRLVEAFYRRMDEAPEAAAIRAMHPRGLDAAKTALKKYLLEWMGGPKLYSAERGHPQLRRRHEPFAIGAAERDAWLFCMREALAETVADADARRSLDEALTRLAFWMRNRADAD